MRVADLDRATAFYQAAFGAILHHQDSEVAMLLGPGEADLIVLELSPADAGRPGGFQHFGIRLRDPEDFDPFLRNVLQAGARLIERGDRGDNPPFALVLDPDGYQIEIWHMNGPLILAG